MWIDYRKKSLPVYTLLVITTHLSTLATAIDTTTTTISVEEEQNDDNPSFKVVSVDLISVSDDDEDGNESLEEHFGQDDLVDLVKELERGAMRQQNTDKNIPEEWNNKTIDLIDDDGMGRVETREANPLQQRDQYFELLPKDLSDLTEDIAEDITAGVEESLRMFGDFKGNSSEVETRQMSLYLFQGQYVSEPRLNRFIDGAYRNMGTEMRISSMDPLYFRVLPRGRVEQRGQPLYANQNQLFNNNNNNNNFNSRRRRPGGVGVVVAGGGRRVKRQLNALNQKIVTHLLKSTPKAFRFGKRKQVVISARQRKQKQRQNALKRRRQQQLLRQRRRKQQQRLNQKKKNQQNKKKVLNKQQAIKRFRRRTKQDVGGGRVEGLSRVVRDADAEMQLFGNYTLIRSHMKMGPVELTMQFRTRNGIRRTGATVPVIRAHTVTRVNHEGSEMVDFLLDRPHPETIKVRGNLFPMAQKIARNIFSRLFLPNSFLVQKMREKTGLALLSKPIE